MFDFSKSGNFQLHYTYNKNCYQPPVDVIDIGTGFRLRIEIAGMKEEDFKIELRQNKLSVSGIRHDPYRNQSFHQMEIHFGEFLLEIVINQPINSDSIAATYSNGFLEISLQKSLPRNILINDKDNT